LQGTPADGEHQLFRLYLTLSYLSILCQFMFSKISGWSLKSFDSALSRNGAVQSHIL